MIWIYRLLYLPALLLLLPVYVWRMFKRGGYREQFHNRFGLVPELPAQSGKSRVWIHAVSVGETLAIAPVVDHLLADGVEVFFTTTTSTGFALARERFGGKALAVAYFPLDFWPCIRAAWRRVRPDMVLLTEGEFWPEFVRRARRENAPVVCANARLSDRSYGRTRRMLWLARRWVRGLDLVLAGSEQDARRFAELGVPAACIVTTGNIKLDIEIPRLADDEAGELRRELGLPEGLVILGSATWHGEEEVLLEALRSARREGIHCSLLIVPRHAERRGELTALMDKSGFRWHLRSKGAADGEVDVCVADTTGELRRLTQLADVAFIGKSLPPYPDGQTPVEAGILGKPMLFGPGMSAFPDIVSNLLRTGAAEEVADGAELQRRMLILLRDADKRTAMSRAAFAWHAANRGALEATMLEIRRTLPKVP